MLVWHTSRLDRWQVAEFSTPCTDTLRGELHVLCCACGTGGPPWNVPDAPASYSLAGDGRDATVVLVSWLALSTRTVTCTTPVVRAWNRARAVPCCV